MTKIHRVIIDIARPTEANPAGVTEEADYTYEGGTVTLVSPDGVPLTDRRGKQYTKKLRPEESPHIIAGRLTKQRFNDRGGNKNDFARPLHYPKWSY